MFNPVEFLTRIVMPTEKEKAGISRAETEKARVGKAPEQKPEKPEPAAEQLERGSEVEQRELREAREREAKAMVLAPEEEEEMRGEEKLLEGLDEDRQAKQLLDYAEKRGYLFPIHMLLKAERFSPYLLDRLHAHINSPDFSHLKSEINH